MNGISKGELTVRILVIIVATLCIFSQLAFGKSDISFDEFIKSREIVTTFYFQPNHENLSNSELKRLSETINKLRELQKNGRMIRVEGFSSPEGDQEENFSLSFFRAHSVAVLIEAKGLPAEVTLTGYGDLRANSDDPTKERRVEIASYVKPVGMKKVKVAEKNTTQGSELGSFQMPKNDQEIDSYRVDQAIRMKINDKNNDLADKNKMIEKELSPGLSQTEKNIRNTDDLDRGYSQWRRSIDPSYSPKLSQSKQAAGKDLNRGYSQSKEAADKGLTPGYSQSKEAADKGLTPGYSQSKEAADKDLNRGYSQWIKSSEPEQSPGVTQLTPFKALVIDALMIEQAIMEKIGAAPLVPSATVSQVDVNY